MSGAYVPILLLLLIVGGMTALILYLSRVIGPRKMTPAKGMPFESGIPHIVPHAQPIPIRFYMIAIVFIVFDLEVIFLYPWAILFRRLGLFGFIEMMIFLSILGVGLLYAWKKGALEWD
jgi:NADH-quinone oxidoreductase subunit A